mgnify:FL=1
MQDNQQKTTWGSYVAFAFAIIFFSGLLATSQGWYKAFDFTVLNGAFGKIAGEAGKTFTFRGAGGSGARDGFLFALELMPAIILALGVVEVVEGLGGLRVAQKFLTPILKPIMGLPGACGLALIANMQSTDAGAGMAKEMYEKGQISDEQRSVFITYQSSASGMISNYFSSGAALFSFMIGPIILPLLVIFVFKIIGANLMRLYLSFENKKMQKQEAI